MTASKSRITLTAIGPEQAVLRCPHCNSDILFASAHGIRTLEGYWIDDGDTLQLADALDDDGDGLSFYGCLGAGTQPCCGREYGVIGVCMIMGDVTDDFEQVYFRKCGDMGQSTNFVARRGKRTWLVERYETNSGPMLEHTFPPFFVSESMSGENGVSSCAAPKVFATAAAFVADQWPELVALLKEQMVVAAR